MFRGISIASLMVLAGACAHDEQVAEAPKEPTPAQHVVERLEDGSSWAADLPANWPESWNGTVLLYARGYSPVASSDPPTAPRGLNEVLLDQGYALVSSSYSMLGWALETSPHDQIHALEAFSDKYSAPKRTIAWGDSMGGLTTIAMAEKFGNRIDGAISMCGSTSGSLGMLNTALDGAFAFKLLLAPDSDIQLVNIADDRANTSKVAAVLEEAMKTPEGRARVALAAVLAQVPGWTDPSAPEPAEDDFDAQLAEIAKSFAMGVFLPRVDQETRGGGVSSWNVGVDYAHQLETSGRADMVRSFYDKAGLDLATDIGVLNKAPRISASPEAVAYMRASYVPTGQLQVPTLTMHQKGDGLTVPNVARELGDVVRNAGKADMLGQTYVATAGHCRFAPAERIAILRALETRLDNGAWNLAPEHLNQTSGDETANFVAWEPRPLLRSCATSNGLCPDEPVASARP